MKTCEDEEKKIVTIMFRCHSLPMARTMVTTIKIIMLNLRTKATIFKIETMRNTLDMQNHLAHFRINLQIDSMLKLTSFNTLSRIRTSSITTTSNSNIASNSMVSLNTIQHRTDQSQQFKEDIQMTDTTDLDRTHSETRVRKDANADKAFNVNDRQTLAPQS